MLPCRARGYDSSVDSLVASRAEARALLDALQAGHPAAVARLRAHHPRFQPGRADQDAAAIDLRDAELVVARERGVSSWPRWRRFAEARQLDAAGRAGELVRAACGGDMVHATMLLEAEPDLARFDLFTACALGEADRVEGVLARDPSRAIWPGGPLDRAPILYACFSRFLRRDPARRDGIMRIVRSLLADGADADAHYFESGDATSSIQTCLYGAAGIANDAELTRMLLDAGADVNEREPDPGAAAGAGRLGTEALYHASEWSDVTCLRLLLEARPPIHPARVSYCLARMLDFENPAGVWLFLSQGADPDLRIPWMAHRTHLHRAIASGRSLEIVRLLVDAGADAGARDDTGMTPIRYAVRHGRDDVVALLRAAGADPAVVSDEDRRISAVVRGEARTAAPAVGARASSAAAFEDRDLLAVAACRNDAPLVRRILAAGADPNALVGGTEALPPLHWACWRGQLDAARALLDTGADVHRRNRYGGDALGTTIHGSLNCHDVLGGPTAKLPDEIVHGDYPGVVEMLIAAGATLPEHVTGSDAVAETLRRHGVKDTE